MKIEPVSTETAREAHSLAFEADAWCGDDCTFFLAQENGKVLGFLAVYTIAESLFISRVAVVKSAQGRGIGKRLVRRALQYGRRMGARMAYTYTIQRNYESMCMLLKSGFRFVTPKVKYAGATMHYFERKIRRS